MADSIRDLLPGAPNVNVRSFPKSEVKKGVNVNVSQIRQTAYKLSVELQDSDSFEFFCKVARQLPEHLIWTNLEKARGKTKPAAWFSKVCSIQIREMAG